MTDPALFSTHGQAVHAPAPTSAATGAAKGAAKSAARVDANAPSGRLEIERAIATAARETNVDFDFLLAQARVESGLNPKAEATASTATGLYQFIESTWLETVKRHGPRFGMGDTAAQIGTTQAGHAFVADPAQREAILAMRANPQMAAFMAAGLAQDNSAQLSPILGRQADSSELYLAHFLGTGGAGRFLRSMATDPQQIAASLFPRPAAANRAIFYEPSGEARSLGGVMDVIAAKMEAAQENARAGTLRPGSALPGPYDPARVTPPLASQPARLSLPGPPPTTTGPRVPISQVLASSWDASGAASIATPQSAQQMKRAYAQLSAMGF